ncbi:MFS transporter [Dactylosporangium sp. NPDC051541]|uniref:MFS transporter n=1 Tax=Dactylosporangium sp. NPDC051541 TaxID=3363977 RepID=UPI0037A6B06E
MSSKREYWVLALTGAGAVMVALDALVVAAALGTIRHELGASTGQLEWAVNAYSLSFALLMLPAALLGDRWGRRRTYAAGLALFCAASAGCALAPSMPALIAARAVQGVGAAAVMPLALALLGVAFPAERRGWAIGVFSGLTGLAVLAGPVVGGAVTEGLAWQWIFWLNVPIGALAIPLIFRWLAESAAPTKTTAAGVLPNRTFFAGNTAGFLLTAALYGAVFVNAQFLQARYGSGPLEAGLRLLPWTATLFLVGPVAGRLVDRFGERPLAVLGLALQGLGMFWIAAASGGGYVGLVAAFVVAGCGVSMAMPAAQSAAVGSLPRSAVGLASGVYSTMRQLGGVAGVAVVGSVLAVGWGHALVACGVLSLLGALSSLAIADRARVTQEVR